MVLAGTALLSALLFGVIVALVSRHQARERMQPLLLELERLKSALAHREGEQVEWRRERELMQNDLHGLRQRWQQVSAEAAALAAQVERLPRLENENVQAQARIADLQARLAEQETRLAEERKAAEARLQDLREAKERMNQEFQGLAQKIFEEKSEKFRQQNQENLGHLLNPLREQLGDFRKQIQDVHVKDSEARASLQTEIHQLKTLNERIAQDALNLTKALKGETKTQGNWGEVILERVLEESGLTRGREYEVQVSLTGEDGRRFQPDVIVRLPGNKDVVVDAKVSLVAYERYCSAETEEERALALKNHIASLRAHLKGLSEKNYDTLEGVRSLDFVLLFVPVEAAFLTAVEQDPSLFRDAFEKNIIVVCPSTLLATLRTIHNTWRSEYQNQNALKIAESAGAMHDQFALFLDALEDIGDKLQKATGAWETAHKRLTSGRGNLLGRIDNLRKLGAKAKKRLPADEAAALENDESEGEVEPS